MDENKSEKALTQEQSPAVQEAQALTELKRQFDALKAENADLLAAKKEYYEQVLNGNQAPVEEEKRDPKVIREEIAKKSGDLSNLDNAKLYVELDDAVQARGGQSIFLPSGRGVTPTADEENTARKFKQVLVECIEKSEGNPDRFNSELKSHMR